MPNDPYFPKYALENTSLQWYLENRGSGGESEGLDLNVRSAWPLSDGGGVWVAVVDLGVELNHPDLKSRTAGGPHFNFATGLQDGRPVEDSGIWAHGTSVASLVAAERDNHTGMVGVAPGAKIASWVIFDERRELVGAAALAEMFRYQNEGVAVQNHSWAVNTKELVGPSRLEQTALTQALENGRGGRGVVMVRASGNDREFGRNANEDAYINDPRVIAVGAVDESGRATPNSTPGACLLVAAPDRDHRNNGLFAADLTDIQGANAIQWYPPYEDLSNYRFNILGFKGASAATPLVSGIAALVLSANPDLSIRDVQQILLLSARHFDKTDPDLHRNGAGIPVSHNVGFGIPDAGQAVRLAQHWVSRSELLREEHSNTAMRPIPDAGLQLLVSGGEIPEDLRSIVNLPGPGTFPDTATPVAPLRDVGTTGHESLPDLEGAAALIQRSSQLPWSRQIEKAAAAGASFAVIYNNAEGDTECPGGEFLCPLLETDFAPIPAVFIRQSDGEKLVKAVAANPGLAAQLSLKAAEYSFPVSTSMICEHVAVRVQSNHPLRGDLRITLLSPQGTRSVLQKLNDDTSPGPEDWTYTSVHHFFESSLGEWKVSISDLFPAHVGSVTSINLILFGTGITDNDADGLDDAWETMHWGNLDAVPAEDPDGDGYSNFFEQVLQTDPVTAPPTFHLAIHPWSWNVVRLSWFSSLGKTYEIHGGNDIDSLKPLAIVPGEFPVTEWFTSSLPPFRRYYFMRQIPSP